MPITKSDLNKALLKQQKNIILEIGNFLEEHVIEPLFDIKKDMKELKHDVEQMDRKLDKSIERADRHAKNFITMKKELLL